MGMRGRWKGERGLGVRWECGVEGRAGGQWVGRGAEVGGMGDAGGKTVGAKEVILLGPVASLAY